jgi:phosphate transport system substrate-binding protein
MKDRKMFKVIGIISVLVLIMGAMAACAAADETPDAYTNAPTQAPSQGASIASTNETVSGSVLAVGSSALQPLAQIGADSFMAINPEFTVQVQGGGSGTGLKQVAEKNCDIGNSDVFAEEKLDADKAASLVDHKVCVVGFATVVAPDVTVTNLTGQQLIDIFTGKVTNWKDVGGNDVAIVILNRPESSGTRATFKKYALNGADEATGIALTEESSGAIRDALNSTPGSISYLALSYVDDSVKALQYDGIDPTAENICSGDYPIWSYEHMYTYGEATGAVKAFLDYMMGADFAPSITEMGYIPIGDMKVSR